MNRSAKIALSLAMLVCLTVPCTLVGQADSPIVEEQASEPGLSVEQQDAVDALVESKVQELLNQEPEGRFRKALEDATKALPILTWVVGAAAVVATLLGAVAAMLTFQAHRGRSEIFAEVTAAQESRYTTERLLEKTRRLAARTRTSAAKLRTEGSATLRELESVRDQVTSESDQIHQEARRVAESVSGIYLNSAIESLATPGGDPESCARRYVAVGIIGELGDDRHIRYLDAARVTDYESELNRAEIDRAIARIRERKL